MKQQKHTARTNSSLKKAERRGSARPSGASRPRKFSVRSWIAVMLMLTTAGLAVSLFGVIETTSARSGAELADTAGAPRVAFTYTNTSAITFDSDSGPAAFYPSVITVADGIEPANLDYIAVELHGLTHTWPDDLDILLVGPAGQRSILMSDAGGSTDIDGVDPFFNTFLGNAVPDDSEISSNIYLPANHGTGSDDFPSPGPGTLPSSEPADLNTFNNTDPTGEWKLYVVDDASGDTGEISGGWTLYLFVDEITATVTKTADTNDGTCDADCSLREALASNANTINFSSLFDSPQTITLGGTELSVNKSVKINGPGADLLTISGNDESRVFNIAPNTDVTLGGVTVTGGRSVSTGGGIFSNRNALTVNDSTVSGNSAEQGGGIYVDDNGTLMVNNSTISGNEASSTGGGIHADFDSTLTVNNSTISGNSAESGGGITTPSTMTINNSTISGNSVSGDGGGIYTFPSGTVTINNSTLSSNSSTDSVGGLWNDGETNLNNSIIANSTGGDCGGIAGTVNASYSLVGDGTCGVTAGTDNNLNGNPMLGPLADNGGPTLTHLPFPNSPVIDAGSGFGATTDQRGEPRPFDNPNIANADDGSDIGAVERRSFEGMQTFSNSSAITFNSESGPADPYPSEIEVTSLTSHFITDVDVILHDVSHTWPDDLDIIVESPDGRRSFLMSDAGGSTDISNIDLTFDRSAPAPIPDDDPISAGSHQPANYATGADAFPAPGPTDTSGIEADLGVFDGAAPDGTWKLWVVDDATGDTGEIAGGWKLRFTFGQTLEVTKTADTNDGACDADCSLREALAAARNGDAIAFATPLFSQQQTITLGGTELSVNKSVKINGPGADLLTISGNDASRVFNIAPNTDVTLGGVTVTGGGSVSTGGGIFSNGNALTVNDSTVSGNSATDRGGGIYAEFNNTLTVNNSTISGNEASSTGGGIYADSKSTLTVNNSTISGNSVSVDGGGIYILFSGTVTLNNSTLNSNESSNGGGIYTNGGTLTLNNSTLSANKAFNDTPGFAFGGGIYNSGGTLTLNNSTLSGNTASDSGGGLWNDWITRLNNSIIANSTGGDCDGSSFGTFNASYSLVGDGTCGVTAGTDNNLTGDPMLTPLGDYGGPTLTHLPLPGSPVIDAGSGFGATTDQRGEPRPFDNPNIANVDDGSDIGAVERQSDDPTCSYALSSTSANVPAAGANGTFDVTVLEGCAWTAVSNDQWISVTGGAAGNGNGTVSYTVAANSGPARSGTITAAGITFTVDQAAANAPEGPAAFDFDGDGKTDVSIFRPTADPGEYWYLRSMDGGNRAFQFGSPDDIPTPADYTGDGKTDLAFYRESTSEWFILRSEDSSFYSFPFGAQGDIPAPGDYDGDGTADPAVFRADSGTWYILRSMDGGVTITSFGSPGDKPVVADYDGDGRDDVAIIRPNAWEWWINRSTDGVIVYQFGQNGDITVPADHTGDGKADVAFWRPSTGFWFVLRSEDSSFYGFPFGSQGDVPAAGDYDGDGMTDAAVFRPADRTWFINGSTSGVQIVPFGIETDVPLPSSYNEP